MRLKKLCILFVAMALIFCSSLSAHVVLAQSILLGDIIGDGVVDITAIDSKQPNVVWDLPENDIKELTLLFENLVLDDGQTKVKGNQKFILYVSTWDAITSLSIYDTGLLVISEDTEESEIYCVSDYVNFIDGLNRILTTQSKGYGNKMPSNGTLVEISKWAEASFQEAMENELVPEYMKIGYMTDNITREQFCDLIFLLLKRQNNHDETFNVEVNFKDTKNENVNYLVKRNIIMGKSKINFAPNDFLTREEAATILCRSLDYLGFNLPENIDCLFVDDTAISEWAKDSVYKVSNLGIMIGMGENTFSPQQTFSKEQAVTTILRIYKDYTAEPFEKPVVVRDLLPSNILEIYYQELDYPNAVWSVDSNKIPELLNIFMSMKVVANSNIAKPFEGYSFAISSDKNPIMLYIRSNGSVSVKQDNITTDYVLSDLQYINKISEILNS